MAEMLQAASEAASGAALGAVFGELLREVNFQFEKVNFQFEKVNLLFGEDQKMQLLDGLQLINGLLKDSEGKRNEQELVNQIMDAALEVEYVINRAIVKDAKRNKVEKFFSTFHRATMRASASKRIANIKEKMKGIPHLRDMRKILMITETSGGEGDAERLHRRRKRVEKDHVVGFEKEIKMLVEKLIGGKSERDVISIIGMGGLGKTTLARKIYNHILIKNHFNCHAWVYVSPECKITDLLVGILKSVVPAAETNGIYAMRDETLVEMLKRHLKGRRYLIVMDDVWETQVWDEVQEAFPDNSNGCRIMITSRLKQVASLSPNPPHFLRFLNKSKSWELLSQKVFQGETCPPQLEKLGKQIAESCDGLPLSIVAMGRILAAEDKTHQTFSKIVGNVNSYLTWGKSQCQDILALSYHNLPQGLKRCFLYIGAFPKDFEVSARQLIQLWIAEGFINQIVEENGSSAQIIWTNLDDVAKNCLEELIDRSLIQVSRRREDGVIKTCRIHNLLRHFCISEAERQNFPKVHTDVHCTSSTRLQRSSTNCIIPLYISLGSCDSSLVRSFLYLDQGECCLSKYNQKSFCRGFKLVRVLDFGSLVVDDVTHIEALIHLRYLRMNAPSLTTIPPFICNLWSLRTLDMRESCVNCLPNGIWKMQQLRHLYVSGPATLPLPLGPEDIALQDLQILPTTADEDTLRLMVKDKFPSLTKLRLCSSSEWNTREFLENLNCLRHLRTLKIMKSSRLPGSPDSFPSSLTKITLMETYLGYKQIEVLENLPNLQILKLLQGSFLSREINFSASGFSQLLVLKMVELDTEKWTMEEGAVQNLMRLVINKCDKLNELPNELCCLTNLRDVEVLPPSSMLARNLQPYLSVIS